MVVSQTCPCTSKPARIQALTWKYQYFLSKSGKTLPPVGCTEALGVTLFLVATQDEILGDISPKFRPHGSASPRSSPCSQAGGWVGTGFRQAQLHLKRLSLQTKLSFSKEGAFAPHLSTLPMDLYPLPYGYTPPHTQSLCNSLCNVSLPPGSTSIQRKPRSIVHLQHL